MVARAVTGEQRQDPVGTSFFLSLKFMCCPIVTRTGNQDHLLGLPKGLGTWLRVKKEFSSFPGFSGL